MGPRTAFGSPSLPAAALGTVLIGQRALARRRDVSLYETDMAAQPAIAVPHLGNQAAPKAFPITDVKGKCHGERPDCICPQLHPEAIE